MNEFPKFFDLLAGVREELETLVRTRTDEALRRLALVRREEFEAVEALASRAKAAAEAAESRVTALEARLAAVEKNLGSGETGPDGIAAQNI